MAKQKLSDWQTGELRLTAFTRDPIDAEKLVHWVELTREQPDVSRFRPRDQELLEAGPFLDSWLTLDVATTRIDWRLIVNPNEPRDGLPTVGGFDPMQEKFRKIMKKWFKQSPQLNRLAFGAVLLLPVEIKEDGYRKLDRLLPSVKINAEKSTDFSYGINRRRSSQSGIEGLEINRLSSWSLARISGLMIEMAADEPSKSRVLNLGEPILACSLKLDINTGLEFRRGLKKSMLPRLFDELVELGNEIATKGDIP